MDHMASNIDSVEKMGGKVSEELIGVVGDYDFIELQKLEKALESLRRQMYEGHEILLDQGIYGGINYEVQKIIFDKIYRGETLTELESYIIDLGAYIMGGYPSHLLVHPALYDKANWLPGSSSPYYPHFRRFVKILGAKLVGLGLVSRSRSGPSAGSPSQTAMSNLLGSDLSVKLSALKKGNAPNGQWDINEASLAKWYIRIENAILASSYPDKVGAVSDI